MKTAELAKRLDVSSTTIKNWTEHFGEYLSTSATYEIARKRQYNTDDVIVLATIAELSSEGYQYSEIGEQLADGYRVDSIQDIASIPDSRMVPAVSVESMVNASELKERLRAVEAERDKLLDMVEKLQTRLDDKEQQYRKELLGLMERAAGAEREVKMLREQLEKDND